MPYHLGMVNCGS